MNLMKTIAFTSLLAISSSASASLFSFDVNPSTGGALGGQVESISTTFNNMTQQFTWDVDFQQNSNIDGFWLVVNNGPNPKQSSVNELAIIYGDLSTGIASTYVYNGANNANSIVNPAILLQTDSITTLADSFALSMSTDTINSFSSPDPDYTGIAYDENIGIWFHFATGSNFSYNPNGDIDGFSFGQQGWYDVSNQIADMTSTAVSAPSHLGLLAFGLFGVIGIRKLRK